MAGIGSNYANARTIVIKSGTGFLFGYDHYDLGTAYLPPGILVNNTASMLRFRQDQLEGLVCEVCELTNRGKNVVIVASGAIAQGKINTGYAIEQNDDYSRAQMAGMGQARLYMKFEDSFRNRGRLSAQCLLTRDYFDDQKRKTTMITNLRGYFAHRVVPVGNENDFVAVEEITFGDNDILAAMLACELGADLLVMMSNPTEGLGTGGGSSKQLAREIAEKKGVPMEILNGDYVKAGSGVYVPKIMELFEPTALPLAELQSDIRASPLQYQ